LAIHINKHISTLLLKERSLSEPESNKCK